MSMAKNGASIAIVVVVVLALASGAWYWFQKKQATEAEEAEEEVKLGESEATLDPEEQATGWVGRQVDKIQDWVAGWGGDE